MRLIIIFFLFIFISPAGTALANNVDAQLISSVNSIESGNDFWVAVKLNAEKDWHTYWRNPGDSGLPTSIEWELPEGFKSSSIYWPYPHIFKVGDLTNYGYDKQELLLVKITPPSDLKPGSEFIIKAKVSWLACRVECIPESEELSISISVSSEENLNESNSKLIEAALNKLPVLNENLKITGVINKDHLILSGTGIYSNYNEVYFLPYESGYFTSTVDKQSLIWNNEQFLLKIPFDDFKIGIPDKVYGILLFKNNNSSSVKSVEIEFNL